VIVVVPEHVPSVDTALVALKPAGNVSTTVVPALFEGPPFVTLSV